MMKKLIALSLLSISISAFASNSYYCDNTGEYLQLGDTINQVFSKCGAPANTQKAPPPPAHPTQVTQWIYNYKNQVGAIKTAKTPVNQNSALIVNMINNKVISVLVNGQNVSSTNFCGSDQAIAKGSTNLQVRQLCGIPSQVQTVTQTLKQPGSSRVLWQYQNGATGQTSTFTFVNGQLTSINP